MYQSSATLGDLHWSRAIAATKLWIKWIAGFLPGILLGPAIRGSAPYCPRLTARLTHIQIFVSALDGPLEPAAMLTTAGTARFAVLNGQCGPCLADRRVQLFEQGIAGV